jgi:hypothetical protein
MDEQELRERMAEWERQQQYLPDAVPEPCRECPWRRNSVPGHLGPYSAVKWLDKLHGEGAIECHLTVRESGAPWDEVKQCRGAAIMRANVCKSPRNPKVIVGPTDTEKVFETNEEFLEHHMEG